MPDIPEKRTPDRRGAGTPVVTLGRLAAEALADGEPQPDRLEHEVGEAIAFYLRSDRVDTGWAYPKFLGVEAGGEEPGVEVPLALSAWIDLCAAAGQQEVEPHDLLQHAALYFAAARDAGRVTPPALRAVDSAPGTSLGRGDDRRSA